MKNKKKRKCERKESKKGGRCMFTAQFNLTSCVRSLCSTLFDDKTVTFECVHVRFMCNKRTFITYTTVFVVDQQYKESIHYTEKTKYPVHVTY